MLNTYLASCQTYEPRLYSGTFISQGKPIMARIKAQPIINRMYNAPPGSGGAKNGFVSAPGAGEPPAAPYQVNGAVPAGRYQYPVATPTSAPPAASAAAYSPPQPQQNQFSTFYVSEAGTGDRGGGRCRLVVCRGRCDSRRGTDPDAGSGPRLVRSVHVGQSAGRSLW